MSMSISARKPDGTFSYEVHNGRDLIEAGDGYPTQKDAETAARVCYHELHNRNFVWDKPFAQVNYMTIDDIMKELED